MSPLLLAYYGDDFTGSTDVMEVLQWSGLRTVLFLDPPTSLQLDAYRDLRAFGVAGWSRNMSTEEMERELPPIFEALRASGAPLIHYKVCSTFDSSPKIGNIGRALEIGQKGIGNRPVPIVVGAPNLGRYQVFGNLFARSGLETEPFRLDRHPTMSHHPTTPMVESDLRRVLALQTERSIGLVDVLRLHGESPEGIATSFLGTEHDAVLFDLLLEDDLPLVGRMIDQLCQSPSNYIVGSSGVEYALTEYWLQSGRLDSMKSRTVGLEKFGPAEQILGVTGSCSPVNARQLAWAEQNGFALIKMNTPRLIHPETSDSEIERIVDQAIRSLNGGSNLILNSSLGPEDSRVAETQAALRSLGLSDFDIRLKSGRILGPLLGKILASLLSIRPMARVGIAGGDTSGYVARSLGLEALEAIAPLAPGAPLCTAHSKNALNGVEFLFKGGQVGRDDVWGTLLKGTLGSR